MERCTFLTRASEVVPDPHTVSPRFRIGPLGRKWASSDTAERRLIRQILHERLDGQPVVIAVGQPCVDFGISLLDEVGWS